MKKNNAFLGLLVTGLSVHFVNTRLFNASKERLNKKKIQEKVYNWKFGTISYQRSGQGKPILLIHDTFSGASSIEYDRIVQQLSKKHTVYTLDMLGYGFSEKSSITYTAYLFIQLIHDFIHDIIKTSGIDVITTGHSNVFALFAAHQDKDLINKIIMINPGDLRMTSMNPTKRDHTLKYLLELPFIGTTIYNILHSRKNYKRQFKVTAKSNTVSYYLDQFHSNAHYDSSNIRFIFASYIANYLNVSVREIIKDLNKSIYIINGIDRTVPHHLIEEQYTDINPSIECSIVKKSSDFPHLENPYATVDLLNLFLND